MRQTIYAVVIAVWLAAGLFSPVAAQDELPVVHVVLFHSPSCSHCRVVIEEVLPPLQEQYGEQLDILMVDSSTTGGQELYQTMQDVFRPEPQRRGVPSLVVGEQLLVGSGEVPEQLPGIIEAGLAAGGIDWPNLAGLERYLADLEQGGGVSDVQSGLIFAWLVLIGLVVSLLLCGYRAWRYLDVWIKELPPGRSGRNWAIVAVAVVGLLIAAYLSYMELTDSQPVCGLGVKCDAVQSSEYVYLLWLPMGVWRVIAYLLILGWWGLGVWGKGKLAGLARPALLGFSLFGVAFSIFLTSLEIFVIKAVCSWCLGSAVATAAICWLTTRDSAWLPTVPSRRMPRRRRRAKV